MAGTPVAPVDPGVVLPPSVVRASEAANAIHAQAYPDATPAPPEPPAPPAPPEPPAPPASPEPPPVTRRAPPAAIPDSGEPGSFEHRYLAMKGRFDQAQTTIGGMQEQMSELGDELMRTQQALSLARSGQPQPLAAPQTQTQRKSVTDADVSTYGPELIEFVTRAARDAVTPELQQVQAQVRQTNQKVTRTAQGSLYGSLDEHVPTWREVNVNPRFKAWCRLPDVYSGAIRGKLLNEAFQAADAPRVVAFFQGFLAEEQATGQVPDPQPQPQPQAAPRTAAIPLDTLAAPGRAKPAGGDSPANAADKPVFTRAQIQQFYSDVRRGTYVGRDADKDRLEQSIFAAQREGRVR